MNLSRRKIRIIKKLRKFNLKLYRAADDFLTRRRYPCRNRQFPPLTIVSLPKAGSVYLQTALRFTLQVPLRKFDAGGTMAEHLLYFPLRKFAKGNVLTRSHLMPRRHLVQAMGEVGIDRILVLVRDPRDAIVSWSRHVDRNLPTRGLAGAIIDVEHELPADFCDRSEQERLRWQIENTLPKFCEWLQGWHALAKSSSHVKIGFCDFADLRRNERQFVAQTLGFFDIKFEDSWLEMPSKKTGFHNIHSLESRDLREVICPELRKRADEIVSDELLAQFGWTR